MVCMLVYSVVGLQWVLFGYSLSFSETSSSSFIGNFEFGGLKGIGSQGLALTAPAIPAILFSLYQMQFATITAGISVQILTSSANFWVYSRKNTVITMPIICFHLDNNCIQSSCVLDLGS